MISSTEVLTTMDGVPVRVWEGVTEKGVKCHVFVHRLAVHKDEDASQFEAELAEQLAPGRTIPLRMVLD
jgi:hypothetical protein